MVDWEAIKREYEKVKKALEMGLTTKGKTPDAIVYSMGNNNPVIRVDIREDR
jgi:hypothetical protein